jgi:hypothetical protein
MNNEKLERIEADIAKAKAKITEYTSRLRELERLKNATENDGIVALVLGVDIMPDELIEFIRAYKEYQSGETPKTTQPSADLADSVPPSYDEEENLWEELKKSYQSSQQQ